MSDELEAQIKALAAKMDSVEESVRTISGPYSQLIDHLDRFNNIATSYFRLLDLYQRHGEIAPDLLIPGVKDSISREIVKVLFDRDGQNITQISEKLRERRGSSSRRIVRERLATLEGKGVVVARGTPRSKEYWLTDGYVKKWYELLGLGLPARKQAP
ncbi:MAG: hypothetical protein MUO94_07235 [Thermoplasmata archaeon]|nr:hypothetical protein [Thermoplasmata archaeon]